jgi:hypothetical protein
MTQTGWPVNRSLPLFLEGEPAVFCKLGGIRLLKKKMIFYKARESNSLLEKPEIKIPSEQSKL